MCRNLFRSAQVLQDILRSIDSWMLRTFRNTAIMAQVQEIIHGSESRRAETVNTPRPMCFIATIWQYTCVTGIHEPRAPTGRYQGQNIEGTTTIESLFAERVHKHRTACPQQQNGGIRMLPMLIQKSHPPSLSCSFLPGCCPSPRACTPDIPPMSPSPATASISPRP